ncbi:MAG: CO dehydrogenase/acetyl-CoA synthase complex subunit epsilon [Candidatus Bathyarchaeales archaeon]
MATAEPWQTAEIPGPKKALVITKAEVAAAMIKKAKRPILIVGHKAAEIELEDKKLIDYTIEMARKTNIPIVATAHVVNEFLKIGYQPADWMPAVDIGNRLTDQEWKGLDGKGQYDLALFVGLPYYMEWTILSGLKHFAPNLKTISLDNYYQPHASWSFPNMSIKDWIKNLKVIIEKVGGE